MAGSALFSGALTLAAVFAACSGGSTPPTQPTTEGTGGPAAPLGSSGPESPSSGAPASTGGSAPQSVADCKAKLSEIASEPPDGGVVMNNAMTSGDAGGSDRFEPLVNIVKSKRSAFRCCFDLWAKKNPGAHGRVQMIFNIKPDGTLTKAEVDEGASGIHAPEVSSCMVDVAKSMSFPKSPSGKETKFTYPFDFQVH